MYSLPVTFFFSFKDQELASCFEKVHQKEKWDETEKLNIELIKKMEKKIKKQNQKAWEIVKKNMK